MQHLFFILMYVLAHLQFSLGKNAHAHTYTIIFHQEQQLYTSISNPFTSIYQYQEHQLYNLLIMWQWHSALKSCRYTSGVSVANERSEGNDQTGLSCPEESETVLSCWLRGVGHSAVLCCCSPSTSWFVHTEMHFCTDDSRCFFLTSLLQATP